MANEIRNASINNDNEWTDEQGRKFTEMIRQEYTGNNCIFSGGTVEECENPEDTMYLRWEKDGVEPTTIMMRPDEISSVNWICAGLMFTEMRRLREATDGV